MLIFPFTDFIIEYCFITCCAFKQEENVSCNVTEIVLSNFTCIFFMDCWFFLLCSSVSINFLWSKWQLHVGSEFKLSPNSVTFLAQPFRFSFFFPSFLLCALEGGKDVVRFGALDGFIFGWGLEAVVSENALSNHLETHCSVPLVENWAGFTRKGICVDSFTWNFL